MPTIDGGNIARYSGKSYGPPPPRHDETHAETPDRFADAEALNRAAAFAPATWSDEHQTVEAVVATAHPVRRRDSRGEYLEILDPLGLVLTGTEGLPIFDGHMGGTARATIGTVQTVRVEDDERVVAVLRGSQADDARPLWQRVAEGVIRFTSAGYSVLRWREGRTADGLRTKTAIEWTLREVSLVPNPADPNARIRSQSKAPDDPARSGGHLNKRAAHKGAVMENDDTTLDRAEIERRSAVRGICRAAHMPDAEIDKLIDAGATEVEAKAAAHDHIATRSASRPVIRTATVQNDDPATIRQRRADALAFRAGVREDLPEASRAYQHDSMMDHARACLEAAGVSTRGLSPDETLHRAAHTTSDFPVILQNTAGLSAMQAYEYASSPLMRLSRQRTVPDFKPATSVRLGEMGALEKVAENGEIKAVSRMENGESIRVDTYAARLDASRQLIINDSLNLFADMASEMGRAAASKAADLLVETLTSNPNLSDGTPVFDASRGNLAGAGADLGGAGDSSALDAARQHFRRMRGLDGKTLISAVPRYLVCSPDAETGAEALLASIFPATREGVNVWTDAFDLLVEPRLEGDAWYLFADPRRVPSLQHAYLSSNQGPTVQRQEAWDTLGVSFRVFMDFGCGWLDWKGAYQNPGAA